MCACVCFFCRTYVASYVRRLECVRGPADVQALEDAKAYADTPIDTIADDVDKAMKGLESVHLSGNVDDDGQTILMDVTVSKGDWVLYNGMWMRVRRVNKKSVTVPNPVFPPPRRGAKEATWTVAWHKLRGHRTTEQMPPEVVEA